MTSRWWTYQAERFPLKAHAPLIAAFSFCAVSYCAALRRDDQPAWPSFAVAFITALIFFLQLRIADEFKDYEEDLAHRPYRPVQRGLVSLRELAAVFVIGGAIQLAAALWLMPRLALLLLGVWVYLALMSKEFFVGDFLRGRPVLYMVSHMAIMPLIDLYATATDWMPNAGRAPDGLGWFLMTSFFNGMVIEIGRKIRSPQDEEDGVDTYSKIWGIRHAIGAWWLVTAATLVCALMAARRVFEQETVGVVLAVALLLVVSTGVIFAGQGSSRRGGGKRIELASGLWTLAVYLGLGVSPLIDRIWP